jgi:hypothetical protein
MNQHDRDNLHFLLTASPEVIKDWYSKMDQDDIDYAYELLAAYSKELDSKSQELLIEAEMAKMDDYPDARRVIQAVVDKL